MSFPPLNETWPFFYLNRVHLEPDLWVLNSTIGPVSVHWTNLHRYCYPRTDNWRIQKRDWDIYVRNSEIQYQFFGIFISIMVIGDVITASNEILHPHVTRGGGVVSPAITTITFIHWALSSNCVFWSRRPLACRMRCCPGAAQSGAARTTAARRHALPYSMPTKIKIRLKHNLFFEAMIAVSCRPGPCVSGLRVVVCVCAN